jgi:hypothetical protein
VNSDDEYYSYLDCNAEILEGTTLGKGNRRACIEDQSCDWKQSCCDPSFWLFQGRIGNWLMGDENFPVQWHLDTGEIEMFYYGFLKTSDE